MRTINCDFIDPSNIPDSTFNQRPPDWFIQYHEDWQYTHFTQVTTTNHDIDGSHINTSISIDWKREKEEQLHYALSLYEAETVNLSPQSGAVMRYDILKKVRDYLSIAHAFINAALIIVTFITILSYKFSVPAGHYYDICVTYTWMITLFVIIPIYFGGYLCIPNDSRYHDVVPYAYNMTFKQLKIGRPIAVVGPALIFIVLSFVLTVLTGFNTKCLQLDEDRCNIMSQYCSLCENIELNITSCESVYENKFCGLGHCENNSNQSTCITTPHCKWCTRFNQCTRNDKKC